MTASLDVPPPFDGGADHAVFALQLLTEYRRGEIGRLNAMLTGPGGVRALDATIRMLNTVWEMLCSAEGWNPDGRLALDLANCAVEVALRRPDPVPEPEITEELVAALREMVARAEKGNRP